MVYFVRDNYEGTITKFNNLEQLAKWCGKVTTSTMMTGTIPTFNWISEDGDDWDSDPDYTIATNRKDL